MPRYCAHGLVIESDVVLPIGAVADGHPTDVTISVGSVGDPPADALVAGALVRAMPGLVHVEIPGVARMAIGASQIEVDVESDAHGDVGAFVARAGLGYLSTLRGLTMRASAVGTAQGAVLFLAHAGAGRSTMAALMAERGFDVVADTVVRLDASVYPCMVHAEGRQLRLWLDTMQTLGIDPEDHPRVRSSLDKRVVSYADDAPSPLPLRGAVLLVTHNRRQVEGPEPIEGQDRFAALFHHLAAPGAIGPIGDRAATFSTLTELSSRIEMVKVARPSRTDCFEATAAVVAPLVEEWLDG